MMLMLIRAMIWITEVAAHVSAQATELGRGGSGLVAVIADADVPGLTLAMIMPSADRPSVGGATNNAWFDASPLRWRGHDARRVPEKMLQIREGVGDRAGDNRADDERRARPWPPTGCPSMAPQ
jgi:hypothetical protein